LLGPPRKGGPLAFVAAAALALQPARASADEPASAPPTPETRWYGYQTLAADGVALGLVGGAVALGNSDAHKPAFWTLLVSGAAIYELGAFTIHLIHRQEDNAKTSTAFRILSPLVGFAVPLLLFGIGDRSGSDSGADGRSAATDAFVGAGVLLPIIVDAVIATEPAPRPEGMRSLLRSVGVVPTSSGRGGVAGVAGTF
jgi:hypothetical protein